MSLREDLDRFFEGYLDAFTKGPGAIAAFYSEPCVTARMGSVRVNATRVETEKLFGDVDRQYRAKGFTHGKLLAKESRDLGANGALATIRWAYLDTGGKTLWETTFSYNLYRREGAWKILVQTMHD